MKKSDFIEKLAEKINLSKRETGKILDEFSALLTTSLKGGDEVTLDVGKFELKKRAARSGVNPKTGEKITVAPRVVPSFKPSKRFKEAVTQ